jgi:hypothetical protein
MKYPKLLFIILTFVTTTFYGCKKDVELMTDPLVGKYKGTYSSLSNGHGPYIYFELDTVFSITKVKDQKYYSVLGYTVDPTDTRYPSRFYLNENGFYLFVRYGPKGYPTDITMSGKRISNLP